MPRPHFRKISDAATLRGLHLIHFTDSKDNKDPNDGKVKVSSIVRQTDHLRDYSNSLLGTFRVNDVFIELLESEKKSYFNSEWAEGHALEVIPQHKQHFILNGERGYFFLSIDDCHNHEIEYVDGSSVKPLCKVIHTPTNSNFWHISLRWLFNGQDIADLSEKERKKGDARKVLTAAKAFIQEKGSFESPRHKKIDRSIFT